mgnify:FL=1
MSVVDLIRESGLTIYDKIPLDRSDLYIESDELAEILSNTLLGIDLTGLAIKTRSKRVNQEICRALGYPVPSSFKRARPTFVGQNFDKYVQKAKNLQIWNEPIDITRRYVVIEQDSDFLIGRVRVVLGSELKKLDKTGKITTKFQASLKPDESVDSELVSTQDTKTLNGIISHISGVVSEAAPSSPIDSPDANQLLSIQQIYDTLLSLIGSSFPDAGADQERNRGAALHQLVCSKLGYNTFLDDGQFPDLRHQLLEVKLQTSPTIDLGLVLPSSDSFVEGLSVSGVPVRPCDIRYALFYGSIQDGLVTIEKFYLSNGQDFFTRFPQFQGKVSNGKIQIPLPKSFFSDG